MADLKISQELDFPKSAVTSTILVYGGKGMGKSNLGSVILEEMSHNGLRWSAIDPMGVLWGIRYSSDGKSAGVPCLILGGAHGDIPLEPTGGAVVADLVADNDVNVIIDISRKPNGEMWGVGERIRFVTDYGKRLYVRQGSLQDGRRREPLFQLIDEAARFMPQMIRAGEPDLAKCLSVWATIVEEGRNIGLGVGIITQRSARINKDVAELADIMLAFRTVGPNSIAAVTDWLGEHVPKERIKSVVETVRSLPIGSALAVSPGWLKHENVIRVRPRRTFDSSATPKPGEQQKKVSGQGAQPDLNKYREMMADTIAAAERDDPKALRKRIAELESDLRRKPAPGPDPAVVTSLQNRIKELETYAQDMAKTIDKAHGAFEKIGRIVSEVLPPPIIKINSDFDPKSFDMGMPGRVAVMTREPIITQPIKYTPMARVEVPHANGVNGPQQKILDAIATFDQAKLPARPNHIASFCGTTARARGFEKNLRTLRANGHVETSNGVLVDVNRSGNPDTFDSGMDALRKVLSTPQFRMLEAVRSTPGITAESLADYMETTVRARGFEENLRRLRQDDLLIGGMQRLMVAEWLA